MYFYLDKTELKFLESHFKRWILHYRLMYWWTSDCTETAVTVHSGDDIYPGIGSHPGYFGLLALTRSSNIF